MDFIKHETTKVDILDYCQKIQKRREYNLQNSLVCTYKFPNVFYRTPDWNNGDWIDSVYTDRLSSDDVKRVRARFNKRYEDITSGEILELAKIVFQRDEITGARLVEFTHMASGYPLFRIDAFWKHPDTPCDRKVMTSDGRVMRGNGLEYMSIREYEM